MNKKEIRHNGFSWVSVVGTDEQALAFLRDDCQYHVRDIEDCQTPSQRSKLDRYDNYLFLVFLFPSYDKERQAIQPFEIDIFLSADRLVTVQERNGPIISDLIQRAESDPTFREQTLMSPVHLLETILQRLLTATYPMIDHISLDVKEIEQRLFTGNERVFLQELLLARRNIAVFRKTMQAHKFILRKLTNTLAGSTSIVPLGHHLSAFENLVEHTKEIWDALEIQKEEVETLAETNESLISYRLNEIMKKYTTLSVMIFAMSLVAALLSIDAKGRPFLSSPNAFWYVVVIEIFVALFLYGIFKRKRWL